MCTILLDFLLLLGLVLLEQTLNIIERSANLLSKCIGARLLAATLTGDVEEDHVFASDDVRDTVAVRRDWTESTSSTDAVWVLLQVHLGRLAVRCLAGRQAPGFAEDLLQERRVDFEVLGHDVQAEQVTIDSATAHGVLVADLVALASFIQQSHALACTGGLVFHRLYPR